ncbi:MAG: hypothetical protein ISS31_10720, partial [Kiritimatiellae bacterium]|nr:hypothetical protein [Kiritimatiellia bacterium]
MDARIRLEDKDPQQERRRTLERRDGAAESPGGEKADGTAQNKEDELSATDPAMRLNAALKTLQIMGQILRNFPGSMEGDLKHDIGLACCRLGLRTLSAGFDLVRLNKDEILETFVEVIREEHHYMIDRSRGSPALSKFFTSAFDGILVTDFWAAYNAVV